MFKQLIAQGRVAAIELESLQIDGLGYNVGEARAKEAIAQAVRALNALADVVESVDEVLGRSMVEARCTECGAVLTSLDVAAGETVCVECAAEASVEMVGCLEAEVKVANG